jgi:hypothetical protein
MALSDAPTVGWYAARSHGSAWDAATAGDPAATADHARAELLADTAALLDLITKDGAWRLADCEAGSTLVVRLADLMARMRAAIARERTLQ